MIPKELIKKIRQIEIRTNRMVNDVLAGEYQSVFKGRGMEFSEVREYLPGDDIRTIDWNVTARTGKPHVKKFVEERELTVMLLVDASSSGEFGTVAQMKGEVAVEICALLAFSAIKNNDRVGLIIFTDAIEKFIPPKKGKKHVLRVIRELLFFEPKKKKTDIAQVLEYLGRVQKRRSVVFLVSDFMSKGFEKDLQIANRKHDLIAITITDPREISLPRIGFIEFQDAESGEAIVIDTYSNAVRELFANLASEQRDQRHQFFRSIAVDSIDILTDKPYVDPLVHFFRLRAKRYH
ncbi:DUF58 domain-containing protein [bacterium]|nr:DUF58 domain-containing protein [bacterium]